MIPKFVERAYRERRGKLLRWASLRWWLPRFIKHRVDTVLWREYFEKVVENYDPVTDTFKEET